MFEWYFLKILLLCIVENPSIRQKQTKLNEYFMK